MRAIILDTKNVGANHVLYTKPSLYICSVFINFKSFLSWHHKLFKHMLREHEETYVLIFAHMQEL